jgi:ABC-type nitrate/sulfonate/bicarbonate transport system ATPase subunit
VHVLARRPSRLVENITIPLARPRHQVSTRAEPSFMELRNAIYRRIADAT